jgi:hypothetical protein
MFGDEYVPNNEIMIWTIMVTQWLEWYDYVREACSWYPDTKCPDEVKDDQQRFNGWLRVQKDKKTHGLKR